MFQKHGKGCSSLKKIGSGHVENGNMFGCTVRKHYQSLLAKTALEA